MSHILYREAKRTLNAGVCLIMLSTMVYPYENVRAQMQTMENKILISKASLLAHDYDYNSARMDMMAEALAFLPPEHHENLAKVTLRQTSDESIARGLASANHIELRSRGVTDAEFIGVFLHEMGHVVNYYVEQDRRQYLTLGASMFEEYQP